MCLWRVHILLSCDSQGSMECKCVCVYEARSCNNCCRGKIISITYSERVFLDLGIQYAMRMCHVVICGLPGYTLISTLSHKRHDKKKLLIKKCVLIFCTTLAETFLILRRITIRGSNLHQLVCLFIYLCFILIKFEFSGHIFRKIHKYQISWKYVRWKPSSKRTDVQTWRS